MNSLVVLLSVVALAAAKPGLLKTGVVTYTAPIIATAPAAVSHQSRVDIKSSPAVVTAAITPIEHSILEPAVIAARGVIAAPSAVSHQSRVDIKSSPAVVTAAITPIEHSILEPAVIAARGVIAAPAAVSHQSRIDIKSSPAVVSTYSALPITYSAPVLAPTILKAGIAPATIIAPSVGPIVPLDTPEVIAARNAHFQVKAQAAAHSVHKRSVPFYGAPLLSTYTAYATPVHAVAPGAVHISPYSIHTPLITKAYNIHPW